jgi:hypothetical protein
MGPIDNAQRSAGHAVQGDAEVRSEAATRASETTRPPSRLGESGSKRAASGEPLERPAPQRPKPLHPADLQQAAYVVAREALGRPLTAESKNLLWTANETRKEVIDLMAFGRGNIESDVRVSGGESKFRMVACRVVTGSLPTETLSPRFRRAMEAALATRAGAGNCGEFTDVSAHLHARHLGEGDRIVRQQIDDLDHVWARVQCATPEGGEPGSGPAAILDTWAEGPIVEPTDSRLGSGTPSEARESQRIDGGVDGEAMHAAFQLSRGSFMDAHAARVSQLADEIKQSRHVAPLSGLMEPIPVVSQAFAHDARNAIDRGSPTTLRASAVDALLESRTPPTREQAEAEADAVVTLASRLDSPAPPPRNSFRPIRED